MDDRSVGLVLRALRRRRGWRQSDLAARAGCSQSLVSSVERGHGASITVDRLRSMFGAVEARLLIEPRWRGAELDRLIDAGHAAIVEATALRLEVAGWQSMIEVTYAVGFERGSIDLLGILPAQRAVFVAEIKSDLPSSEAVARKLDEKARLAPTIVRSRLGWAPSVVGVALVFADTDRLRRLLAGPAATLARRFPVGSRRIQRWLASPAGPIAGTWFVSISSPSGFRAARRVRASASEALSPQPGARSNVGWIEEAAPPRVLR